MEGQGQIWALIGIGVVSGILTSVFLYFLVFLFKNFFIPWYQNIIYKGLDISGEWEYTLTHQQGIDKCIMELKQKSHMISGDDTGGRYDASGKKRQRTRAFKITGFYSDNYFVGYMLNKNPQLRSFTGFTLRIVEGGRCMEGVFSWYDVLYEDINSQKVKCKRIMSS
ncbi:MAG: hypothetical protein B6I26_08110 [Desulfobacteraceae bacterium 4572_130]|nr:MAG: hypothetical protein B6I26_08110 [Desulfobacteraceae bacterium 4572_130]